MGHFSCFHVLNLPSLLLKIKKICSAKSSVMWSNIFRTALYFKLFLTLNDRGASFVVIAVVPKQLSNFNLQSLLTATYFEGHLGSLLLIYLSKVHVLLSIKLKYLSLLINFQKNRDGLPITFCCKTGQRLESIHCFKSAR